MSTGIELSIRDYRKVLIDFMPPWMELKDMKLLEYFSLSGFTYINKIDSIVVDGTEYQKDEWTLEEFKTDLGIAGTGDYDDCVIDIIEYIDDDDNVYIYTNYNIIMLDAMASIIKKLDDRRNLLFTELNPWVATSEGLLPFWEALFQSERITIDGVLETDSEYMARAITELFGQSASLIVMRRIFAKYGLTDFELYNSWEDEFLWNAKSAVMSVNLHLDPDDYSRISVINTIWYNSAVAGIRLFILCPAPNHDCYCLNYGNSSDDGSWYEVPSPFIPGVGIYGEGYGASYGESYGDS